MANLERTGINLPADLKREARIKAIREGSNLSEVVRALLALYIKGEVVARPPGAGPDK